jgi:MFS family permease
MTMQDSLTIQDTCDRREKHWTLGIVALASFMMALDALIVTTAFATIRQDFNVSVETLQWVVNAYNLSFAVLLLTGSALGDRFGRRGLFAAGITLFTLASVACALSASAAWLIAARLAQGAAAALVMPLGMAILSTAFAREERARALGIFSGVTGFALIVGPAAGGLISENLGWRWVFWINLPIGMIVVALVSIRLRESFSPKAALDIPGLVTVAGAALALVWGLLRGNALGWASLEIMSALGAGALLAVMFVSWEMRTAVPMLPMRLRQPRTLEIDRDTLSADWQTALGTSPAIDA